MSYTNLVQPSGSIQVNQGPPNDGGANSWPISLVGLNNASLAGYYAATFQTPIGQFSPGEFALVTSSSSMAKRGPSSALVPLNGTYLFNDHFFSNDERYLLETASVPCLYDPTISEFTPSRQVTIFKTASATASGSTSLWTPTSGTKFRLMRYRIELTGNAAQASGGVLTIKLLDNATDLNQTCDLFVPSVPIDSDGVLYSTGWIDLGNGQLSSTADNILKINLSAALTAGNVRVVCCGTEE